MKTLLITCGMASVLFYSTLLSAQVVTNGSVTGAPAANSGINSGNAAGWSGCGFSPDLCSVAFASYTGNSQVPRIASPDGGTWLGIAALGECAQTTITGLTVGSNYILRFCGANFGTGALFNGSPAAPIITVGTTSVTLSIPQVANTWNPYQLAFTATAASMALRCSIPNGSNAYASLDGFNLTGALCNPVILPVDFLHFKGEFQDCKVILDWEGPENEVANAFEIQRSPDGELFETIEKVEASDKKIGKWVDAFPLEAAYYRIRMYNETGRVAESPVALISGICQLPELIVLGNPVVHAEYAYLKFTAKLASCNLKVSDASGRLVAQHNVPTTPGIWNEFALPVQGLRAGVYLISTSDGATSKLVLQ